MANLRNTFFNLFFDKNDSAPAHTVSVCDEVLVSHGIDGKQEVHRNMYFEISKYEYAGDEHLLEKIAKSKEVYLQLSDRNSFLSEKVNELFAVKTLIKPGLYQGADRIRIYITEVN